MSKASPAVSASSPTPSALSNSAALLKAIVLSSEDAIITKTLDGTITSWNPAASRIFGYEAHEIVGQSILRLIPERLHFEEAEIIARLRSGQQIAHYQTTRVRKDGREIIVSLTISPLKDKTGTVIGASKIARDVTEQNQVDRARVQLAAIVESSDDAILSKDLDGTIITWNQAASRVFGYTQAEMVGESILKLIPPDLHAEEREILRRLRAGERIEHFETERVRKSGERFPVSLTISPMKNSSGKIIGASKILRDISERRKLEQSLIQAEKLAATGRMAASIAHEINNPLEALLNLIYLARENAQDASEVREFLSAAESEVVRVSHLARQTLGFYRETSSPSRLSVSELVRSTLKFYEPRLKAAGIQLCRNLDCDCVVTLKRGEMAQVISNLIANSMNAMPEGGVLTVTVRPDTHRDTQGVTIEITDTGSGIPEELLERVFEAFFTTRSAVGTGIGLWITRKFVEGHGGSITVRSSTRAADHGTCMSIFLPMNASFQVEPGTPGLDRALAVN